MKKRSIEKTQAPKIPNQPVQHNETSANVPAVIEIPAPDAAQMLSLEQKLNQRLVALAQHHMVRARAQQAEVQLELEVAQIEAEYQNAARALCQRLGIDLDQPVPGAPGARWHLNFIQRTIECK